LTTRDDALAYHSNGRPGKLKVSPTKPTATQRDLSLAYTPGVAEPCRKSSRRTLADALDGADVFVGLSQAGAVDQDMVKSMADSPIIFAMANPDPEIHPADIEAVRSDAIIATGRSDFPIQGSRRRRSIWRNIPAGSKRLLATWPGPSSRSRTRGLN
jgi:malic enzyme